MTEPVGIGWTTIIAAGVAAIGTALSAVLAKFFENQRAKNRDLTAEPQKIDSDGL